MPDSFDAAWRAVDAIPGWLTRAQARELWGAASSLSAGTLIVEIGSHQGRSTVLLATAARRVGARVVAIDPFVGGTLFGGASTRARFEANVEHGGVADVVRLITRRSTDLRLEWTEPIGLLYIDGKHDYRTATDDLRWTAFLPRGATVLVHDSFSSIGVTLALLRGVLPGWTLRYAGRAGSLARFTVGPPAVADRLHLLRELPWFARNVLIKLGLRLLRLVGQRRPDPF